MCGRAGHLWLLIKTKMDMYGGDVGTNFSMNRQGIGLMSISLGVHYNAD